ncbi:hypothetical protein L1987_17166 [Smallanthus sonchifolius]|uniref:Uncharacterized protein n=1 Tax=Smallanthus sonchifolius TaxID=185202 RepID=A0ACB9IZL2_9ASTR|nr:hypothetical protein L1987_17166 [Smallanthus sonchifolius]
MMHIRITVVQLLIRFYVFKEVRNKQEPTDPSFNQKLFTLSTALTSADGQFAIFERVSCGSTVYMTITRESVSDYFQYTHTITAL